jgi:hypothetical protein
MVRQDRTSSRCTTPIATMATDLLVMVVDPAIGAVVCDRYLGGLRTLESARTVLQRPPNAPAPGLECWSNVSPSEVEVIAEESYGLGAVPSEIAALAIRFPAPPFIWMIVRDF